MATITAQQSLELAPPPSSRQDIISALLSEYGTFGDDDRSIYSGYSPTSPPRELPPPPPPKTPEKARKYSNDKPLPYGGRMSMRFQLRVDEPASPASPVSRSSRESQPKRINYKSISRDSKPPSLTLVVSNGSTAKVPSSPNSTSGASYSDSSSRTTRDKEKILPPPPPPPRSERRVQQSPVANRSSPAPPERKDSTQSREKRENVEKSVEPIQRKPVPQKSTSLLAMKNMPRGGKGGPLPVPRSRNQNLDPNQQDANRDRPSTAVEAKTTNFPASPVHDLAKSRTNEDMPVKPHSVAAISSRLPPTPVQDEEIVAKRMAPPPPQQQQQQHARKPFAGMGLPSNPRAKQGHVKGKSSTGFDWMKKSSKTEPSQTQTLAPILSPVPNTITPGPTPPPEEMKVPQQLLDATSPMDDNDQRRPFSFEGAPPPPPPPKQRVEQAVSTPVTKVLDNLPPRPLASTSSPAKPTLSPLPPPPTNTTLPLPAQVSPMVSSSSPPRPIRLPAAFANLPSQQPISPMTPSSALAKPTSPNLSTQQQQVQPASPTSFKSASSSYGGIPSSPTMPDPTTNTTTPANMSATNNNNLTTDSNTNTTRSPTYPQTAPTFPADPEAPFTPLTQHPLATRAAPITAAHLTCYTAHAHSIWSKNEFQPQACMACSSTSSSTSSNRSSRPGTASSSHSSGGVAGRQRMWACTWCYLRICVACSIELRKTPGRDLASFLASGRVGGDPSSLSTSSSSNTNLPPSLSSSAGYAADPNPASSQHANGPANGKVMSMLVEEPEVDASAAAEPLPKRHDSGTAGAAAAASSSNASEVSSVYSASSSAGAQTLANQNQSQAPDVRVWKADGERYKGEEVDFS